MRKRSAIGITLITGALMLSGCSAANGTLESPAGQSTPDTIACDQAAITSAIRNFYSTSASNESTGLSLQSVESVRCAGDWAVAQIVVGDGLGHDLADHEVARREGGIWTVADRMTVCGTWNPKKPAQIPDDAAINSSLYAAACTTN